MNTLDSVTKKVTQVVENVLEERDAELDQRIKELQEMDDDDLARLRQQRISQMKKAAAERERATTSGFGSYDEVSSDAEAKDLLVNYGSLVVHFFRQSTWRCGIVDKHLTALAQKYLGTKFVKVDVMKCILTSTSFNVRVLPSIFLIEKGLVKHVFFGFDEFGARDDFSTMQLLQTFKRFGFPKKSQNGGDDSDSNGE